MASSTNTLSNEKWRGNLLFRKDLRTCMDFDSDGKTCDNLGNLDTNQKSDDKETMDEMMSGICCQTIWEEELQVKQCQCEFTVLKAGDKNRQVSYIILSTFVYA